MSGYGYGYAAGYLLRGATARPPAPSSGFVGPADFLAGRVVNLATRRLFSSYSGPALLVREAAGGTEATIGFTVDGSLDVAALLAFVGSSDGFVKTWYDQSGNNNHMTQALAANQPAIASGGAVYAMNGKPALYFDAARQTILSGVAPGATGATTRNAVYSGNATGQILGGSAAPRSYVFPNGQINMGSTQLGAANPANTPMIATGSVPGAGTVTQRQFLNGALTGSGSTVRSGTSTGIALGAFGPANAHTTGLIPEIMVFSTELADVDRLRWERDQGAYYGITVA